MQRRRTKQDVERFQHQHLKFFEHQGYDEVVEECVRYVADNCVAVKEIVLDPQSKAGNLEALIRFRGGCRQLSDYINLYIY